MPTTKTIRGDPIVELWAALVSVLIEEGAPPRVAIGSAGKMIARLNQVGRTAEKDTGRRRS